MCADIGVHRMLNKKVEEKMLQAQTTLVMQQAFFGLLTLRLELIQDEGVETACTDGKVIMYNPSFVEKMPMDQVLGLLCHEVMHCAIGTIWRRGARIHKLWNIAEDYAINAVIEETKGIQLPVGGLLEPQYSGLSGEEIYAKLPVTFIAPKGWDIGGTKEQAGGEGKEAQVEWQVAVQQAASVAKARGQLPASLEKFVGALLEPTVDWRAVLWRFLQASTKDDFSYRRPSQRGMTLGAYLPILYSERVGEIVWAVDTSRSTSEYLTAFASEFNAAVLMVRPSKTWVMYADCKVQKVEEFEEGEAVIPKVIPGGGGTSFCPVFDEVEERGIEPVCLVYLTDLEGQAPKHAPGYPVLWVTPNTNAGPWGETVRMRG